jgi:V/A-type H+-transporting ATPase subunit E
VADLSALLDKEASAEIETVLSEAQARASEIVAEATSEAEALLASRRRAAEAQRDAALVRARSAAQLEAASLRLKAQHAGVENVFTAARQKIADLAKNPAEYAPLFANLLKFALEGAGNQPLEAVVVNPADREVADAALKAAGVTAKVETSDDVVGGVRLRTGNRSVIESTLFGRLEALQGELASEVSTALFGAKAS